MKKYGIYSADEILVDTCETEEEAMDIVKFLNDKDPFALPFERCTYYYKELNESNK